MKNNFVKNLALIAVVLTLTLLGTACGNGNNNSGAESSEAVASESSASVSEEASGSPEATPEVVSGVFNGVVDSQTIEIQTGMGPIPYQVSSEIADKVSAWEKGTKIKYQYKENTITSIDKE